MCTNVKKSSDYESINYENTFQSHVITKQSSLIAGVQIKHSQEFFIEMPIAYSPIKRARSQSTSFTKYKTAHRDLINYQCIDKKMLKKQKALTNLNYRFIHNDNQLMDAQYLTEHIEMVHLTRSPMLYSTPELNRSINHTHLWNKTNANVVCEDNNSSFFELKYTKVRGALNFSCSTAYSD